MNARSRKSGKMEIKLERGLLEDLIAKAGGCAVVGGGFATQLEKHGASINDSLWSAVCLIKGPGLAKEAPISALSVHLVYLEAGADILMTSSYQDTIPGFLSKGFSIEEGELLLKKNVKLAVEARDEFWDDKKKLSEQGYNRAQVAASIGSYGAYLADGSEYSGHYGAEVDLDKLKDFHRRRLQVLVEAGPDLLAFETIPNKLEAQACVELLEERHPDTILDLFQPRGRTERSVGGEFEECFDAMNRSTKISAVGINCAPPHLVEGLVHKFNQLTEKIVAIYPNRGEVWDGRAKRWLVRHCFGDEEFKSYAIRWRDAGAKLIGGSCGTTPSTIQAISNALKRVPR
ncbi:Homocysteine S-methyltransferase [Bertholletia excelsa]